MALTKEQILDAKDVQREQVEVPEWGGFVFVKMMTGEERDAFETSMFEQKGNADTVRNMANLRARLCALCICDENGHRVFTDKDAGALGKKSAKALSRIFDAAQRLNGLGKEDIEELTKNSEGEA